MDDDSTARIAALHNAHDRLAEFAAAASAADLAHRSMCSEWSVAQVLSHLGSGAEIGLATNTRTEVDAEAVWARWNAMAPREMAASFVAADERLVSWFESLTAEQRAATQIHLPFLPAPISVAEAAGFRLSEVGLHSWDVFASFDVAAEVEPAAAEQLVDRLPSMIALLGSFMPRDTRPPGETSIAVATDEPPRRFVLELGERLALHAEATRATAGTLTLPAEALVRLTAGRLPPDREHGATVSGPVSLDDLRRAFPGY